LDVQISHDKLILPKSNEAKPYSRYKALHYDGDDIYSVKFVVGNCGASASSTLIDAEHPGMMKLVGYSEQN
jgi:hypothetical protein